MHQQRGSAGSDSESLRRLGGALARLRLARDQTQAQLADAAGVSRATVQRLEAGQSTQLTNLVRVLRALDLPGLESLVPEPEIRPLEVLERGAKRRRRASGRDADCAADPDADAPWSWDPEAGE